MHWRPTGRSRALMEALTLNELKRRFLVISHGWAPATLSTYGTGLLLYHVYCDQHDVSEERRCPTDMWLLQSFIAECAGGYARTTVDNAIAGVRAWHLLHGMPWTVRPDELEPALRGVSALAPPKQPPRAPVRVELMRRIFALLTGTAFDVAWWACFTTVFWSCARLGEFVVPVEDTFDARVHITPAQVVRRRDAEGNWLTVFSLPWTKVKADGEEVFWAAQEGSEDPEHALHVHMTHNAPPADGPLFAYRDDAAATGASWTAMTRSAFLGRLKRVCDELGVDAPHGHSLRIGGTLEYLLRGIAFDVVKTMGRWSSDAFQTYLREHALILAPYLQARPHLEVQVARAMMPRRLRSAAR
jgi:hypothetical protein